MVITTDDLCLKYLENFILFDDLKKEYPDLKMIAFTIANYKNEEDLSKSDRFKKWFDEHKDWVEIAVHSYDHLPPPDGDRPDEKYWIEKARDTLKEFLPENYGYRSAGFQTTNKTLPILKGLGFSWIGFENNIRYLNEEKIINGVMNSHIDNANSMDNLINLIKKGKK